jgi:MoaA/NifB/PqqE/SkfB family radical SAM enzyme
MVSFLWLELTNRCNLRCTHCYAESEPHAGSHDVLQRSDYERVMTETADIGCRQVQFIGGEPTLNADLVRHIEFAARRGFTFIEGFSNLTRLDASLIECFRTHGVHVATSIYAATATTHDAITKTRGSFDRTTANVRRLRGAEVAVRAGVIEMQQNAGQREKTIRFLNDLGVSDVRTDRLRRFGRAATDDDAQMSELCGSCAGGTLCVADTNCNPCPPNTNCAPNQCPPYCVPNR